MKTITKKFKVFEFKELSNEIKDKVIEKHYNNEDYPFLEDDLKEELNYIDDKKVFQDVKLQYSLSCCQGDGLCFDSKIDLKAFLSDYSLKESVKRALQDYIYNIITKNSNNHYCYASKNQIDFEYNGSEDKKHIENVWQNVFEDIKTYYMDICSKLEKYGYSILEYRMNYNEFQEYCESNEYEFLENGSMFN
jgi:hypothetical protein